MEECGIEAEALARHSEAVQLFTSRDGTAYRSHMYFIECRALRSGRGEGEHETRWLGQVPDRDEFAHEAHHFALESYM